MDKAFTAGLRRAARQTDTLPNRRLRVSGKGLLRRKRLEVDSPPVLGGRKMSFMFEVSYKSPLDTKREAVIAERIGRFGGRLTYREEPDSVGAGPVCLTYEFNDIQVAQEAASCLRAQ